MKNKSYQRTGNRYAFRHGMTCSTEHNIWNVGR